LVTSAKHKDKTPRRWCGCTEKSRSNYDI